MPRPASSHEASIVRSSAHPGYLPVRRGLSFVAETWTDSGARSEARNLKHRDDGAGRIVPCPPELANLLHRHIEQYGVTRDGRLFAGTRNEGRLSSTVYGRAWAQARAEALPEDAQASPLAKRPYDPPPCRRFHMAECRGRADTGRRVGRPQRSRPAPRLRQVPRRRGEGGSGSRPASPRRVHRTVGANGREHPHMTARDRAQPGPTLKRPSDRFRWSLSRFDWCAG